MVLFLVNQSFVGFEGKGFGSNLLTFNLLDRKTGVRRTRKVFPSFWELIGSVAVKQSLMDLLRLVSEH